jgi:hypothetical protein
MVDAVTSHVVALSREPIKQAGIMDLGRSSRSGFGSARLPSLSSAMPRQVDVALDQQGGPVAGGDSDGPAPASTASASSSHSNGSASFLSSPAKTASGVSSPVLGVGAVGSARVSAVGSGRVSASPTMPAQSPGMAGMSAGMSERKGASFFERKGSGASSPGDAGALESKESSKDLLVAATRKMSTLGLLSKVFVQRTKKKTFLLSLCCLPVCRSCCLCVLVCFGCAGGGDRRVSK